MGDQVSMFGGSESPRETHVVSAHTRVLADGTESFVAEHRRWNRGGTPRRRSVRPRIHEVPDEQLDLI